MGSQQHTSTLLGSSGQWVSIITWPNLRGAVGSGTPSVHRHTTQEHWVAELLLYSATLMRAVGSGTPTMRNHTVGEEGMDGGTISVRGHSARE